MYIAHIREFDGEIQSVEDHLIQVSELAGNYGKKIGFENLCRLAGLLHDLGKISNDFTKYIKDANSNKTSSPTRGTVDHSTLGGKYLFDKYAQDSQDSFCRLTVEIISNVIVSHHGYLQDYLSINLKSQFLDRMRKDSAEINEAYDKVSDFLNNGIISSEYIDELMRKAIAEVKQFYQKIIKIYPPEKCETQLMFLIKVVFSTLIDADRTNTRQFEQANFKASEIDTIKLFSDYYEKLMEKVNSFEINANSSIINIMRSKMSVECDNHAQEPPGIYTLSIPTGGGKTLASFRYALKHAMNYHKERIIYILPYTTIIEQNAEEIRKIIADPTNILEHHSNVVLDTDEGENVTEDEMNLKARLQLVKDNWDVPIIFSTLVQFLEIFYAKGTRPIRRLHNLANSIIIFDEVQKVPSHCISLFNEALNFLQKHLNCTILLCTATQPSLEGVTYNLELKDNHEIVTKLNDVMESFKRVEIIDLLSEGTMNTQRLSQFVIKRMKEVSSQLIIMNTKIVVKNLYKELTMIDSNIEIYHLSTSMSPEHRKKILIDIKKNLEQKIPTICISTQLIEAGVDISFESVIRSIAGLDSIAQAAGRCNRHGERELGEVYIFEHSEEKTEKMEDIETGKKVTKKLLSSMRQSPQLYNGNLLSSGAMTFYFDSFFRERRGVLNHPHDNLPFTQTELLMSSRGSNQLIQEYRAKFSKSFPLVNSTSMGTAAKNFYVIKNQTKTLIVPYGSGEDVITLVNGNLLIDELYDALKHIQQCSIQVYQHELDSLMRENAVDIILDGQAYILKPNFYSDELGLNLDGNTELKFTLI